MSSPLKHDSTLCYRRVVAHTVRDKLRYLAIPLRLAPLLLIVSFSVLLALAIRAGLFGLVLGFLLTAGLFRYAFVLLDELVVGKTDPPVLSIEMLNLVERERVVPVLVFTLGAFFGTDAALYWFGPALSGLAGMLVLSIVPAIVAVQGVTSSPAQAMNPLRWFRFAQRLGRDYLLIVACIGVLYLAVIWAAGWLPRVLWLALLLYAWLAMFSLVGGIVFERREDLALDDSWEPETIELADAADVERSRLRFLDRVYAESRSSPIKNSWQSVEVYLRESEDPLTELRWLYDHTRQWPDPRLSNRIAQELIPKLLVLRHNGEALDVTRERLARVPDFRPFVSADLIRLAELARDAGDRRAARQLLQDFSRFYPSDPPHLVDALSHQLER